MGDDRGVFVCMKCIVKRDEGVGKWGFEGGIWGRNVEGVGGMVNREEMGDGWVRGCWGVVDSEVGCFGEFIREMKCGSKVE